VAIIGELVAACVPQHVAVDEEAKASSFTGPGDHALVAKRRRPGDPPPINLVEGNRVQPREADPVAPVARKAENAPTGRLGRGG
jgi:hypothetical protein